MLYMRRIHIYLYTFGRFVGTICGKHKKQTNMNDSSKMSRSQPSLASVSRVESFDVSSQYFRCGQFCYNALGVYDIACATDISWPKRCLSLSNSSATLRFPWSGAAGEVNLSTNILLGAPSEPSRLHPWPIMEIFSWTVKAPFCFGLSILSSPNCRKIVGSTDDIPLHGMMSCCNLLFKPAPLIEHWGWWEIFLGINPHQNPWKNINIIIM